MTVLATRESTRARAWPAPGPPVSRASPTLSAISFGDIFNQARGGRSSVYRGADLRYNLEIPLEQAARGTETRIRIPTYEDCDTCKGSGAKPGTKARTCATCEGQGQVRMQQGFFSIQQTCPKCHGTGKIIPEPCPACHGAARVKKQKTLSVKIPAGVDDGDRIRLSGEGEPGVNGGPAGDLYVQIQVKSHPVFQRDHDDLHCRNCRSVSRRRRSAERSKSRRWTVRRRSESPTETQSGKIFRLRGKRYSRRAQPGTRRSALPPSSSKRR